MNIYTSDGWLDVPHIAEICDRNNINFIIIIGKRQVGKTYGVLKYMIDSDKRFIFTRRVKTELDMLCKNVNSPFEKIYPGLIEFKKNSEYTAVLNRLEYEETEDGEKVIKDVHQIGTAAALSTIGNIRGFNGDIYTDWVFDEFIPEEQLFKVRNEGDAFLNAHVTINGNRELEGRPCIRTWLLANSNNINSDILLALGISNIIEYMSKNHIEDYMDASRGVLILFPESNKIIEQRKKGGLAKLVDSESDFSKMAFENEFAYNDFSNIGVVSQAQCKPLLNVGKITVHMLRDNSGLYISQKISGSVKYTFSDKESGLNEFNNAFGFRLKNYYSANKIKFQNALVKKYLLTYLNI